MGGIAHLFGEDIAGVDHAWNVGDFGRVRVMGLADVVLPQVEVFDTFVSDGGGPVDAGLVVIVDGGARGGVGEADVVGPILNGLEGRDAFVGGDDFSLAGAEGGVVLSDGFPSDGPP